MSNNTHYRVCCYCATNSRADVTVRFIKINEQLILQWKPDALPRSMYYICSRHFYASEILKNGRGWKVSEGSIPLDLRPAYVPPEDFNDEEEPMEEEWLNNEEVITSEEQTKREMNIMAKQPKFYFGIQEEYASLIDDLVEEFGFSKRDLFITLSRIKQGFKEEMLAHHFGLSQPRISQIFTRTVPVLADIMQEFIFMPSIDSIQENHPVGFKNTFSSELNVEVRMILIKDFNYFPFRNSMRD